MAQLSNQHFVAATALIRNDAGEILLVRTERRGWEMPGGQIERGETLTEGLEREILEESGVQVKLGRLALVNTNVDRAIVILGFLARYVSGDLRTSEETPEVAWVSLESAADMITHPAAALRLQDMLANRAGVVYRAYRRNPFRIIENSEC